MILLEIFKEGKLVYRKKGEIEQILDELKVIEWLEGEEE